MAHITLPPTLAAKIVSRKVGTGWPAMENRSGWAGTSKIILLGGGERSRFQMGLRPLVTETEFREARAFFWALEGIANTFDLPVLPKPQGGTNKTVNAIAAAGAKVLTLNNTTGLLNGMPVSITLPSGHRRFAVITLVSGVTINIRPAITEGVAVGAAVEVINPVCRVRSADPFFEYDDTLGLGGFSTSVVEAI